VNDWSPDDVEDIFTMRGMLEGYAAQRAASRITEDELDIMQASADAIETAIADPDEPDVEAFLAANRTLHETLRQAANSTRLNTMLGQLVEMPVVIRTATSYTPGDLRRSNDHHQELIDALRAGDGTWAEATMVAHIHAAFQKYRRAYQPPEG
jgi:DNA-binding GntR family transcriptional regulator